MAESHLPFSALKWQMPANRKTAEKICPRMLAKEFQNVGQAIWLTKEWLEAETAEQARALLAAGAGHRCTPGESIQAEIDTLLDD